MSILLSIQIETSIWVSFTHHHFQEKPDIIKKQKLISLKNNEAVSTGNELFWTQILRRPFLFSIHLFSTFWVTLFHLKIILWKGRDPLWSNSLIKYRLQAENEVKKNYKTDKNSIGVLECILNECTYAFQSESTLYICLNIKELLAQNRRDTDI